MRLFEHIYRVSFVSWLIFFLIPIFSNAQVTFNKIIDVYSHGESIIHTTDGGYAICGQAAFSGNAGQFDLYVVKVDSNANIQWTRAVGGSDDDWGMSIVQTFDGGYAITGTKGWGNAYVVKLDANGNVLWDKTIVGSGLDSGWSIIQTSDSGLTISGGGSDMYIIRLDAAGSLQWTKKITTGGRGHSIIENNGGGYTVCGHSVLYGGSVYVARLSSNGDILNGQYIGGVDEERGHSINHTYDGGYFAVGWTGSFGAGNTDVYILKLDSNQQVQWTETIGGSEQDEGWSGIQTTDSGYAIVGMTASFSLNGDVDVYVIKLDKSGNIEWTRTFGGCSVDWGFSIIQTPDKGYAICGQAHNVGGWNQLYFTKIDSNGNPCSNFGSGGTVTGSGGTTITGGTSIAVTSTVSSGGSSSSGGVLMDACSQIPVSNISSWPNNLCDSGCVYFGQQTSNCPTSFIWLFPGATPSTSTDQNPANICYNTPGMYDVTLITSNAYGSDTLTLANYITVYIEPAAPVITQSNDTLTSSAAYNYQWFMNGGVIPGATNQQLIITQSGDYSVTITDSLGCSASDTIAALLLLPQSAFNSSDVSGCPGSCFDFTNASFNTTTYQWLFPGGNPSTSTQQDPSNICYPNPGVYDVTLIASSNFASDTLLQAGYITIFTPLAVSVSQNGNFLTCNPAASSYQWSLNGSQIAGATSQSLYINQTGDYTVDVVDSNGCSSSATIVVIVLPSPNFSSSDTSVCEKLCLNYSDQSTNSPTAWKWKFEGGDPASSTIQNPQDICYNIPGIYDVTLITSNAFGNDTLTLNDYITVHPTPTIPFITQNGYTLTSDIAYSYQWQLNATDIWGATNQSYTVSQTGFYNVIVFDEHGCYSSSTTILLEVTGINSLNSEVYFTTEPNPSNGTFTISLHSKNPVGDAAIEVIDVLGRVVYSESLQIAETEFSQELSIYELVEGNYWLWLKSENYSEVRRIMLLK